MVKHRGIKWTVEETEMVRALYKQGVCIGEIVKQIGRSESAIQKKIKEFGETGRRVDWTEDDLNKLKSLFNEGLGYSEIAKQLGKTVRACQGKAVRLGLRKKECNVWVNNKRRDDFWTDEEIALLKDNIGKVNSSKELVKIIGRSSQSIFNKMGTMGLKIPKKSAIQESIYRRVYSVNDDYFAEIDSQKKAYWLGWMVTDGYVIEKLNTKRQGEVFQSKLGMQLSEKDLYVLEDFSKDLNSTFPLKFRTVTKECVFYNKITGKEHIIKGGNEATMEITSAKMLQDLKRYGIHQNKTYDVGFPSELKEEFYPGFIAGVISGDGSVSLKNNHGTGFILRTNIAGNYGLLEKIKEILVKNISFNPTKAIMKVAASKTLYTLELNQTETLNMYAWFKSNGVSLMKRKNEIIEEFMERNNMILV